MLTHVCRAWREAFILSTPGEPGGVDLDVSELRKMMIPRRATLKKKILGNVTLGLANYRCHTRRLRDTGARVKAFRTQESILRLERIQQYVECGKWNGIKVENRSVSILHICMPQSMYQEGKESRVVQLFLDLL